MTTKEKKEYAALAAILLVFAVFIYWSFFRTPAPKVDPAQIQAAMAVAPASAGGTPAAGASASAGTVPVGGGALPGATPVGGATTAQTSAALGQFLPHGTNLDFKILQDSRFQRLLQPVYPTVDRSEVGQDNPFENSLNSKNSSTNSATNSSTNNAP